MIDARRRPVALRRLRLAGLILGGAGAAAVAVGAVLPWTRFGIFGTEFSIPGVMGWGALTLAAALAALVVGRRAPLLAVAVGMLALGVGAQAQRETGRAVKGRVLELQRSFDNVNSRLMQVGLPPIEPFERGRLWRDFVGPGPLWTFWGGAALAVGAAAVFAGERLGRSCPRCGITWSAIRAGRVTFCPACGIRLGPITQCRACGGSVEPKDTFCATCGASLSE